MKKLIISLGFVFIANIINAQFKIALSSGYQYPSTKNIIPATVFGLNSDLAIQINSNSDSKLFVPGSLGSGFSNQFSIGYIYQKKISFDLGIGYNFNTKFTTNKSLENSSLNYSLFNTYSVQAKKYILLSPSISYYIPSKLKFEPYITLGIILPFNGNIVYSTNYQTKYDNGTEEYYQTEWKVKTKFSVGLKTNLGLQYSVTKKLKLFAEINSLNMNKSYKTAKLEKYTLNGIDKLNMLNTFEKEIEYVDNVQDDYGIHNPNALVEPRKIISINQSFSTIGLSLGISLIL